MDIESEYRKGYSKGYASGQKNGYNQAIEDAVSICLEKSDSDSRDVDVMMQAAAISDCADAILALKKGGE
jgi:flagellar biosynthesis/type III secretory pathway protein FliH